jgi:uncharacterized membrane protein
MWSREGNMLVYYLFLRPWVHVGDSEFMLRLPSVIFAVAAIPPIYLLGRELFGRLAGLIAAALLSVHMFHVFLSRQARSYSLLVFLLLLSAWSFVRFTQAPQRRFRLALYSVVSALAVYAHIFALLVLVSQWLTLLGARGRRIGWRRTAAALAFIFFLALPMLAFVLLKNKGQLDWVPALNASTFVDGIHAIAGYGNLWLSALYAIFATAAVVRAAQTNEEAFALRVIESWLLFPVLAMLLYSLHKPIFHSRFLVICVPALILLAARGLAVMADLRPHFVWVSAGLSLLLFGISASTTWHYLETPACADWKPATHFVLANTHSDDAICFAGTGAEVFLYYMQREQHTPWIRLPHVHYSRGSRCLGNSPEAVAQAGSPYRRAWLLKTDSSAEQYRWISQLLASRFGSLQSQPAFGCPVGKITVQLLP